MPVDQISDAHLVALARYVRDEISTGRLAELLGVSIHKLFELRAAVQGPAEVRDEK